MNERTKRQLARLSPLWKTLGLMLIGIVLAMRVTGSSLLDGIGDLIIRALSTEEEDLRVYMLVHRVIGLVVETYRLALIGSVLALIIGGLSRLIARSHVRAGQRDPLERVRSFVEKHPRWALAFEALPALGWATLIARSAMFFAANGPWEAMLPQVVFPTGIAFFGIVYLVRSGVRALLAPLLDRDVEGQGGSLDAEGFTFDAVAVTPQTLGAIAAMIALTLGVLGVVTSREALSFLRETHTNGAFFATYIAAALGGSYLFARKSKVAIGLDGVLIGGTSKRRFVAYRDIDHARALGETIELRARARTVLRLQLHGEDAGRRVAIVNRLNAAIARVQTHRADPAAAFVEGASVAELTRAAEGAASYRMAAPTREKLWEIFESPVLAAEARRAAAEALVPGIDAEERTRFRIAADHVAEPATRLRLQELLENDAEEEQAKSTRPARALDAPVYR